MLLAYHLIKGLWPPFSCKYYVGHIGLSSRFMAERLGFGHPASSGGLLASQFSVAQRAFPPVGAAHHLAAIAKLVLLIRHTSNWRKLASKPRAPQIIYIWRRGWDLNPGTSLPGRTLSRRPVSATHAPLHNSFIYFLASLLKKLGDNIRTIRRHYI